MIELWTPNRKTIEPMPVCAKCGGLKLSAADRMRDTRRYWRHGACQCCEEAEPCTDCNPNGAGSAPNAAVVSDVDSGINCDCTGGNGNYAYDSFTNTPADGCEWLWERTDSGAISSVELFHATSATTWNGLSLAAGEWGIRLAVAELVQSRWTEKTTGFACSTSTGRVSGSHTFDSGSNDDPTCCEGSPSVTVAA